MAWEHFEPTNKQRVWVIDLTTMEEKMVEIELGPVFTGKQRVPWGNQCVLHLNDESIISKSKDGSRREVLWDCYNILKERGYQLLVAGVSKSFYQTGLSSSGGYGYLKHNPTSLHMLDYYNPFTNSTEQKGVE
jgi:hypothetical protein